VLQDDLYAGTKFRPDIRYATILNLLFVVMFFSGGMPVLMPIASLACIVTFWLDKYLCTCPLAPHTETLATTIQLTRMHGPVYQ